MALGFMTEAFPALNTATSTGLWSLIVALAVACTVLVPMRLRHWADLKASSAPVVVIALGTVFGSF